MAELRIQAHPLRKLGAMAIGAMLALAALPAIAKTAPEATVAVGITNSTTDVPLLSKTKQGVRFSNDVNVSVDAVVDPSFAGNVVKAMGVYKPHK